MYGTEKKSKEVRITFVFQKGAGASLPIKQYRI